MAWSARFMDELAKPVFRPVWRLSTRRIYLEPGADYCISSAPGYLEDEVLISGPPQVQGSRVTPVSWSSTIGRATIPLSGDISGLLSAVTRGTVLVLEMGFVGWAPSDFEVVAWGALQDISGVEPAWTLTLSDPLQVLASRLTTTLADLPLFSGLGASTTVATSDYTGTGTLNVASTTGFERDSGGSYGVKVTPSSGDDPYYILATGSTATTFTGCTDGGFGLAVTTAAIGSAVDEVAYLEGHPLDIARRLLISQGAGSGMDWDDYPRSWGWGVPTDLVDVDDIQGWRTFVVVAASGSITWQVIVEEPIEDPYTWLSALLADAGLYLTTRMGLLTVRGGELHTSSTAAPYDDAFEIAEADIVSCQFVGLWSSAAATEYASCICTTATGSSTSTDAIQTLPATSSKTYDLSDRVYANEAAVRDEVTGRLTESACRIPEEIRLVLSGLWFAQLAPGSTPYVTTTRLRGRLSTTRDGYAGRIIYVTQVSPDYASNTVTIGAVVYPTSEEVFG
jgi:hypothetical protein